MLKTCVLPFEPNKDSEEQVESQGDAGSEPKIKKGRKVKEPVKEEQKYVPNTDSNKRGFIDIVLMQSAFSQVK